MLKFAQKGRSHALGGCFYRCDHVRTERQLYHFPFSPYLSNITIPFALNLALFPFSCYFSLLYGEPPRRSSIVFSVFYGSGCTLLRRTSR